MAKLGDLFPDDLAPKPAPGVPGAKQPAVMQSPRGSQAQPAAPRQQNAPRPLPPRPPAKNAPVAGKTERVFVKDLVAGQDVEGIYLVAEATLRSSKNGSRYVQATFGDRTGSIPVRHWDANDVDFGCYKVSGYVKVRGRIETYKNALQMIAFSVQDCAPESVEAADFLPVSTRPQAEMEAEFNALLETFTDPDYKQLLQTIFSDADVRARFMQGPAAASVHHAWVGGLVEHVLSACRTAQSIAEQRPFLNRDLLLAGVVLHDIGKIEELDAGPGFTYTDSGKLCGHIVLGALLVERNMLKLPGFPRKKRDLILHMILSHHGELEYGSPVTPVTAEAVALHHLECLDAKVQGIQSIIEKERAGGNDNAWSDFARVVDGRIYKG